MLTHSCTKPIFILSYFGVRYTVMYLGGNFCSVESRASVVLSDPWGNILAAALRSGPDLSTSSWCSAAGS